MLKPLETKNLSAIPLCAKWLNSDVAQTLRLMKLNAAWWIAPAVMAVSGVAGWIATIPLN